MLRPNESITSEAKPLSSGQRMVQRFAGGTNGGAVSTSDSQNFLSAPSNGNGTKPISFTGNSLGDDANEFFPTEPGALSITSKMNGRKQGVQALDPINTRIFNQTTTIIFRKEGGGVDRKRDHLGDNQEASSSSSMIKPQKGNIT